MKIGIFLLSLLMIKDIVSTSYAMDQSPSSHEQVRKGMSSSQRIKLLFRNVLTGPALNLEELEKLKPEIIKIAHKLSPQKQVKLRQEVEVIFSNVLLHQVRLFRGNEEVVITNFLDDILPKTIGYGSLMEVGNAMDDLDQAYHLFLQQSYPDLAVEQEHLIDNFMSYIKTVNSSPKHRHEKLTLNTKNPLFLSGKYGFPVNGFWSSWGEQLNCSQGWKIHISAMPHSATKIAQLILPVVLSETYISKGVVGKIIPSIPLMRTLWSHSYIAGQETQPGKFIVLYACSSALATEIAGTLDSILAKAKKDGILSDTDFYRLLGDAKVGYSGGVYVRYGGFTGPELMVTPPSTIEMVEESTHMEMDNPFFPWPDFMNKANSFFTNPKDSWTNQLCPLKGLPLEWKPYGLKGVLTWDTRPGSWQELFPPTPTNKHQ